MVDRTIGEKKRRSRSERRFPLPTSGMSFENEIAVLKAIVEFSNRGKKAITYKDVKIPNVSATRVSSELKFLESVNILKQRDKRGEYLPSQEIIDFVNKLNWGKEAEAKIVLRQLLLNTWFGNLTVKLLNVKEVSVDELIAELGKEAMADPKRDKKSVTRLIEWLKYADILEIDENNKVKLKEAIQLPTTVEAEKQQIESTIGKESKIAININVSFIIEVNSQTKKEDIVKTIRMIKDALQEIETDEN